MSNVNRVHGTPKTPQTEETSEVQHGQQGQQGQSNRGVGDSPTTLEKAEGSNNPFSNEPGHHAHGRPFTDPSFHPENAQGKPFTDESFAAEKGGSEPALTRAGKKKEKDEAEDNEV